MNIEIALNLLIALAYFDHMIEGYLEGQQKAWVRSCCIAAAHTCLAIFLLKP